MDLLGRAICLTYRPSQLTSTTRTFTGLSSEEKRCGHGLKVNTASGEFQSMPQRIRSLFESLCLPQGGVCCWPYAPRLIYVDQRQRKLALEWKRESEAQGQQRYPP
jgi:hypothetical protein